jgi:hypothetical protein
MACALVSVLAGALAVVLTFLLARRLGHSSQGAAASAMTLALCTIHRTYSSTLWNHALAAFLVVLAAWMVTPRAPRSTAQRATLGLVLGYLIGVDYSGAVVVAVLSGCLVADDWRDENLARIVPFGLGLLCGIAPALIYQKLAFGSPFVTPYRYHAEHHAITRSLGSLYSGSFFDGLFGLLFSYRAGLLLYSPILLLGLFSLVPFIQKIGRRSAASTVLPWLAMLLVTAKHATWDGGGAHDARYLNLVMPLLCLPVALACEEALVVDNGRARASRLWLFGVLFFVSALSQFIKHTLGWMQNGAQWFGAFADIIKGADPGPTLTRFLHLLFPHPFIAAAILCMGLGAVWFSLRREPS